MAVFLADEQDLEIPGERLLDLARHVLVEQRVPTDMELSLLFVDEQTISELNAAHMGESGPTDVLAFPIDEPGESPPGAPAILGDVVLCPAIAYAQAERLGRTPEQELELLTVHGILHLLGMDHADPAEEREMFALTDQLLAGFRAGVTRS